MESKTAIGALGALAQETRLAIFRLLVRVGPEGLSAGAIGTQLTLAAPTLSFHLAQLRFAGLIEFRRRGRSLIYAAEFGTMTALIAYLTENCCEGAGTACASSSCEPRPKTRSKTHETPARSRSR